MDELIDCKFYNNCMIPLLNKEDKCLSCRHNLSSKEKTLKSFYKPSGKPKKAYEHELRSYDSIKSKGGSKSSNSGRKERDGDFKTDTIMFDHKLQSTNTNWSASRDELKKVNADAIRSGKQFGVLIIENKNSESVVVLNYSDFLRLI